MKYIRRRWRCALGSILTVVLFNLYFIFLVKVQRIDYLLYLDFLWLSGFFMVETGGCIRFYKKEREKRKLLARDTLIFEQFSNDMDCELAAHDVDILKKRLQEKFDENCELSDYVARWCHECKLPLSAALLAAEKIEDVKLRRTMLAQLERMRQQIHTMMLGCKIQSALFDLQYKKTDLSGCVRASVKNNQFFLIQKGFSLELMVDDIRVYTDGAWVVYILDQLISNAVKYAQDKPLLRIRAVRRGHVVRLSVEDNGAGIKACDIRRIFEKGYVGSNYHNGKYRSTGMGLYMAAKMAARLGIGLDVESVYGEYSRFWLTFEENEYYRF